MKKISLRKTQIFKERLFWKYRKFLNIFSISSLFVGADRVKNQILGREIFANWSFIMNFGDSLNPILIKYISGIYPRNINFFGNDKDKEIYAVIGSTLSYLTGKNNVIWGAGFISSSGKFIEKPRRICAVRGPLTRKLILKQGIDCPKIYGDPALLVPLFYNPSIKKRHKLGIIPHFVDRYNPFLEKFKNAPNILVIDITKGYKRVIKDIKSCEFIGSSSLHGIIIADAYGIPSTWIKFSDNVLGKGFKFRDYFMSVGRKDRKPLVIDEETSIQDIYNKFYDYKINIDLEKLMEVCPFKK